MAETEEMTYFAKFKVDATEFLNGVSAMRTEFLAFVGGVTAAVAIAAVAFDQYNKIIQQYGKMATELRDLSYATGISTTEIQKFHYAATLSGDDVGMVDAMLGKLTLSMGQFADKTSAASKAFTALGVDPTGKDPSEVFYEIAKAMENIPNASTRASIAIDILGRSYKDSLPFMQDYLENSDKIKSAVTYSPDELQAMADYKKGLDDLGHSWEVFWGKFLFGKPTATKENIDSTIALYKNQYHYTDEQIKKALVDNYGLTQLQSLGYYPSTTASTRVDFKDTFAGMSDYDIQLDKLTKSLGGYTSAMEAARQSGDATAFNAAAESARLAQIDIDNLNKTHTNTLRDENLQYQQMIDITLPQLKEKLDTVKKTGLKSEIEAATIALQQGVNAANDLGKELGKAAVSAGDIKSSITIASGWSSKSVIGTAGSNMAAFMIDEMQHGASYQVALDAWAAGAHSYSSWTNGFGTLGAAIDASVTVTRNPGKNEREATAAAAKAGGAGTGDKATGATGAGTDTKKTLSTADQAVEDTKTIQTELGKQAQAFTDLYQKIRGNWGLEETDARTHWTALTEFSRIGQQNIMQAAYEAAAYAGRTPIIQKIVHQSAQGYDLDPSTISVAAPITLAPADFSQVVTLGGGSSKQETDKEDATSTADKNKAASVTVVVNAERGVNTSVTKQESGAQANLIIIGGGTSGL